jgi:phosphoadenosine phosphosulfate reductase
MVEFVRRFAKMWDLIELASDQPARLAAVGLPARIVPIANTAVGFEAEREPRNRLLLTDWLTCCADLRGRPLESYVRRTGPTLVIHGQRWADNTMPSAMPVAEVLVPLHGWSDKDVHAYIEANGIELPPQYAHGADSLECWNCTAEDSPRQFRFMAAAYPNLLDQLRPMLAAVYGATAKELQAAEPGLIAAGVIQPDIAAPENSKTWQP